MAGNLKGIILDIGGDTSSLSKSLQDVDKQAKQSQDTLKEIEKALKFDPSSTDLLNAKQRELQSSLKATEDRLELLRQADKTAKQQLDNGEIGIADYAKLQAEIGHTEKKLQSLQDQTSGNLDKQRTEMKRAGTAVKELDATQAQLNERMRLAESQYRETGDETQYAADRSQILTEQVDTQKAKVNEARAALNASSEAYGETSKSAKYYGDVLATAEKELESYEKSLKEANEALAYQTSELPKAEKEIGELDKKQESLNSQMKLAESQYKLTGDKTAYQTEKVKLLSDQVATQERKVEAANVALEEATRLYGEGDERVEQYAREVDKATIELVDMQVELKKNSEELTDQTSKLKKVEKGLEDLGSKLDSVGKGMTVGITAPLMAVAAAAGVAWAEIDDALDGIATASGATGDALEDLQKSFKNVYGAMPAEAADVSEAIGEINTQFGWTGEELERTTEKAVKFAAINNTQLSPSIQGAKGVISALNLDASDFGRVLDAVTVASQNTGLSTDSLFNTLQKGAPQINSLNLEVEDAAMLLGRMEQAGLDSSRIMGGLTRAQGTAAKEGKTLNDVLSSFSEYANSGAKEADVMNEAVALFGTRNGPAMAQAAQQGVFDFDALAESVRAAGGAVEATFEATLDPIDMAQVAMNNLKLAGSDLFDAIQVAGTPALEGLVEVLQGATTKISEMSPETMDLAVKIGAVAIAAGPTISVLGKLTTGASNLVSGIGKATSAIGEKGFAGGLGSLIGPGGKIMLAVAAIGLLAAAAVKLHEELKPGTDEVRSFIKANEEMADSFVASRDSIYKNRDGAVELLNELDRLRKTTALTADEQSRMSTIVDILKDQYPDLNLLIDEQTGLLNLSTEAIKRQIDAFALQDDYQAGLERANELRKEEQAIEDKLAEAKERSAQAQDLLNESMSGSVIIGEGSMFMTGKYAWEVKNAEENVSLLTDELELNRQQQEENIATMSNLKSGLEEYRQENKDTADTVVETNKEIADSEHEKFNALQKAYARERKLRDDYNNNIEDYYSELERLQQGYIDAVDAFGDKEFKLREANAKQLRKYQEDSLKAYLSYESNMNALSKKVPADVLEEMRKLGPDGAHIIQEYVNMTDSELQPYIDTWQSITGKAMDAALEELKGHPAKAAEQALETVRKTREELQKGVGLVEEVAKETVDRYTDTASGMKWAGRDAAKETVDEVKKELDNAPPRVRAAADKAAKSYREGIDEARPGIKTAAQRAAAAAKAGFIVSAYSEGANAGQSFASGLAAKQQAVRNAAAAMAREVPTGLRNVLQIKSPSRVMAGLADDTVNGYVNQLLARVKDVELAGNALGNPLTEMDTKIPDIRGVIGDAAIGRHSAINNTNNENITINVETHGAVSDFDARRIGQLVHEGFVLERRSRGG